MISNKYIKSDSFFSLRHVLTKTWLGINNQTLEEEKGGSGLHS